MINTLMYARKLEEVGIPREQAETHVQILSEIVEGDLATKQDLKIEIQGLENKLMQMEYRLIIKSGAITTTVVAIGITILTLILKN